MMMHAYSILFVCQLLSLTGASKSGIVGGKVAKPHSIPSMASLQIHGHHTCGGILIREDFVLTAAHCKKCAPMTVVLGAHDISKEEKSQQRIPVAKYFLHPKYTGQCDWDIMLLKLEKNATINREVQVIGLPKKNGKVPALVKCKVAGWGLTGANGQSSNVLKEAREEMEEDKNCTTIWQTYFDSSQMICTKFDKKSGGVCQGDSGGPLICNSKPQGITIMTLASDCNDPKYPHIFAKIHFFLPWIKEVMRG